MKSIDLETLKMIMALAKPAPIAPVAPVAPIIPLDYTKTSENAFGIAKDVQYLREAMIEMKAQLTKITDTHVTITDAAKHAADDDKKHADGDKIAADHEIRIANAALSIARIQTWGAALFLVVGIAETLLIHFWK